jgi:hypothetical protein
MPLKKGSSKETVSANIEELHRGDTYARTKSKYGKKKADKQAVAIALAEARRSKGRISGMEV